MAGEIQRFDFHGRDVRIADRNGNPWFIGTDVCETLGYANPWQVLAKLDEDEKGLYSIETPGGQQDVTIISEAGLYSLVLRSRKPDAKAFKRWVTHDVLPTIRQTGRYALARRDDSELTNTVSVVATALVPAITGAMTQAMTPLVALMQQQHEMLQTLVKGFMGESNDTMLPQHTQYISIEGWCRVRNIRMDFGSKQTFGKRATAFCKEHGIKRGTVPDERYGRVGSYPVEVLDELWRIDEEHKALWAN